jgi:hypothetical protein
LFWLLLRKFFFSARTTIRGGTFDLGIGQVMFFYWPVLGGIPGESLFPISFDISIVGALMRLLRMHVLERCSFICLIGICWDPSFMLEVWYRKETISG